MDANTVFDSFMSAEPGQAPGPTDANSVFDTFMAENEEEKSPLEKLGVIELPSSKPTEKPATTKETATPKKEQPEQRPWYLQDLGGRGDMLDLDALEENESLTKFIKATKKSTDAAVNNTTIIGRAVFDANTPPEVRKKLLKLMDTVPPQPEPESVLEQVAGIGTGLVSGLFTGQRLVGAANAFTDDGLELPKIEEGGVFGMAVNTAMAPARAAVGITDAITRTAAAAFQGLIATDGYGIAGTVYHELMQDPNMDEQIAADTARTAGAATMVIGAASGGALTKIGRGAQQAIAASVGKSVVKVLQRPLVQTASTFGATMTAIEGTNAILVQTAIEQNSILRKEFVKPWDKAYIINRTWDGLKHGLVGGILFGGTVAAAGGAIAVPYRAGKRMVNTDTVKSLQQAADAARIEGTRKEEAAAAMLAERQRHAREAAELADIERDRVIVETPDDVVAGIKDVAEADIPYVAEDVVVTRNGETITVPLAERTALLRERAELRQELYGGEQAGEAPVVFVPDGVEVPKPPKVPFAGLKKAITETRDRIKQLKKEGFTAESPEMVALVEALKWGRELAKEKEKQLADVQKRIKDVYEPVTRKSTEKLAEHAEARARADAEARPGWIEDADLGSYPGFQTALQDMTKLARAVRTAATDEGKRVATAQMRAKVAEVRTRQRIAANKKKIVTEINEMAKTWGGKQMSALTPQVHDLFRAFSQVLKLNKKDAAAMLSALEEGGQAPGMVQSDATVAAIAKELLRIKARAKDMTLGELNQVKDDLARIFEAGNLERLGTTMERALEASRIKEQAMAETGGRNARKLLQQYRQNPNTFSTPEVLTLRQRAIRFLERPGHELIRAWDDHGRVLLTDIRIQYKDSAIGKIFNTIEQEIRRDFLRNTYHRDMLDLISTTIGLDKGGDFRAARAWLVRRGTEAPQAVRDSQGRVAMTAAKMGKDEAGMPVELEPARNILFTPGERLQRAGELLNPRNREMLKRVEGYTDETIDIITDLSYEEARLLEGMRALYDRLFGEVSPVYGDLNGRNLGYVEGYFPISRDWMQLDPLESNLTPLLRDFSEFWVGDQAGKKRTVERQDSDLKLKIQDAFSVMSFYTRDMTHYIAFAKKVNEMNALLRDVDYLDVIRARFGNEVGNEIIHRMQEHLNEISRGYSNYRAARGWIDIIRTNSVKASMAAKILLGMKQIGSFTMFADAEGLTMKEFTIGVAQFLSNPREAVEIMNQAQYLKDRGMNIDPALNSALGKLEARGWDKTGMRRFFIDEVSNTLLKPIYYGDKAAIYMGGFSMYRHYLKQGIAPEEARAKVMKFMRDTQQSTELTTQSRIQRSDQALNKLATTYSTATFSMLRQVNDSILQTLRAREAIAQQRLALAELIDSGAEPAQISFARAELASLQKAGKKVYAQSAKRIFLYHILAGTTYQFLTNLGEWDWAEQGAAAVLGGTTSLPVMGDALEALVRGGLNLSQYQQTSVITPALMSGVRAILDIAEGEADADTLRKLAEAAQLGLPLPLKQLNDVVASIADEDLRKTVLLLFGSSKYMAEKVLDEK